MKIYLLSAFVFAIATLSFAQNDRIILENDVLFKGKISVTADTNSIFIGDGAGSSIVEEYATLNTFIGASAGYSNTTGRYNTFLGGLAGVNNEIGNGNVMIGLQAGLFNTEGSSNVFVGQNTGYANTMGDDNLFLGNSAGFRNTTGDFNTYIGAFAGFENLTGTGNVFIGRQAGQLELGSNKLYISNSSTSSPLIYGEFDTPLIELNGTVHIKELLQLEPMAQPTSAAVGTIYYDMTDNKVKVMTATGWENLN